MEALSLCVSQGVDFIEFPAISDPQWSARTGPMVAKALREAEPYSEAAATAWLLLAPVRVAIVYGSAWPSPAVWSARPPGASQASVRVGPGQTALQRMPSLAYRSATRRDTDSKAAF